MKPTIFALFFLLFLPSCASITKYENKRQKTQRLKLSHSVVIITVKTTVTVKVDDPLQSLLIPKLSAPKYEKREMMWSGTAFAIKSDIDGSDFITNHHICKGRENAEYTLIDYKGGKHKAKFIKTAPGADLCILHTRDNFEPLKLAKEDAKKGQELFTIGAADGVFPNFANGVVAGKTWLELKYDDIEEMTFEMHFYAQITSMPIYHGSSGSPVFNAEGEVVGVVFALNRNFEHASLIVPVSEIHRLLDVDEDLIDRDSN